MKNLWVKIIWAQLLVLGPIILTFYSMCLYGAIIPMKSFGFNIDTLTLPVMLLIPGFGLLSLWVFATKFEEFAQNKIPTAILVGLGIGVVSSLFSMIVGTKWFSHYLVYLYGGYTLVLTLTVSLALNNIRNDITTNQMLKRDE